jgi:hypothetical protein
VFSRPGNGSLAIESGCYLEQQEREKMETDDVFEKLHNDWIGQLRFYHLTSLFMIIIITLAAFSIPRFCRVFLPVC